MLHSWKIPSPSLHPVFLYPPSHSLVHSSKIPSPHITFFVPPFYCGSLPDDTILPHHLVFLCPPPLSTSSFLEDSIPSFFFSVFPHLLWLILGRYHSHTPSVSHAPLLLLWLIPKIHHLHPSCLPPSSVTHSQNMLFSKIIHFSCIPIHYGAFLEYTTPLDLPPFFVSSYPLWLIFSWCANFLVSV